MRGALPTFHLPSACSLNCYLLVQYFWFRHLFTLPAEQSAQCQQLVVQLTRDKKYEVQEMAAGTLAGLLKGLSEPAFHSLRCDLLHQAQQLFPKRNRSRAGNLSFHM